jgi:hypothetical protein
MIGWEALPSVPLGTRKSMPSNIFPFVKWGRVLELAFSGGTPF